MRRANFGSVARATAVAFERRTRKRHAVQALPVEVPAAAQDDPRAPERLPRDQAAPRSAWRQVCWYVRDDWRVPHRVLRGQWLPPVLRYHRDVLAADIEDRLDEWSRWARSHGRYRGHAMSAEGMYRSPQSWEVAACAPPMLPVAHRAMEVEHAVVALLDPFKLVLVGFYVHQVPPRILQRRLRRWRVRDPQPVLAEARRRVAQRLGAV